MKRAFFLTLLLGFISPAHAECYWEGSWYVCPQPDEIKDGIRFSELYKYSRPEAVPGKPLALRYWIKGEFSSQGKYIGFNQSSWSRYYELDCQNKSETMLDDQYSGDWGRTWDKIAEEQKRNIGHTSYYTPDSMQERICQRRVQAFMANLEAVKLEEQRKAQEEAAKKALEQQKSTPKPATKKAASKK